MKMKKYSAIILAAAAACGLNAAEAVKSAVPYEVKAENVAVNFAADCREMVIPCVDQKPDLTDFPAKWQKAAKLSDFKVIYRRALAKAKGMQAAGEWKKFLPKALTPSEDTIVYMAYDKENLYIAAECLEKPGNIITRQANLPRDSKIYSVDSLELLIFRDRADADCRQFITDIDGHRYDALRNDVKGVSDAAGWNPDYVVQTGKKGDNWLLFWALPWKILNITPEAGKEFAFNMARNKIAEKNYSSLAGNRNSFAERDRLVKIYFDRKTYRPGIDAVAAGTLVEGSNVLTVTLSNPAQQPVDVTLNAWCNDGAKAVKKVNLPAKSKSKVRLSVSNFARNTNFSQRKKEGNNQVNLELLDNKGQVVSMAMFTADAREKLAVSLASYAIMGTENTIAGKIEVNAHGADDMLVEVICGSSKSVLPAKSVNFTLDVADVTGDAEVKVRLLRKKNKSVVDEKVLKFNRESDPFA